MQRIEYFPIVNEEGEVIGKSTRTECHSKTFLLHPVVHLHILNSKGELYLQKRSATKDIQPNKWDTAVGGHVDYGEDILTALFREAREELGISGFNPQFMIRYKFTSDVESELVHSFYTIYEGNITPDMDEVSEGKFWKPEELQNGIGKNIFTPNFEKEFLQITKEKLLPVGLE